MTSTPAVREESNYAWAAQEGPQRTAIWMGEAVQELFYGGAVFGGKNFLPPRGLRAGFKPGQRLAGRSLSPILPGPRGDHRPEPRDIPSPETLVADFRNWIGPTYGSDQGGSDVWAEIFASDPDVGIKMQSGLNKDLYARIHDMNQELRALRRQDRGE